MSTPNLREQIQKMEAEIAAMKASVDKLKLLDSANRAPFKPGQNVTYKSGKMRKSGMIIRPLGQESDRSEGYGGWRYLVDRRFKNGKTKIETVYSGEDIQLAE